MSGLTNKFVTLLYNELKREIFGSPVCVISECLVSSVFSVFSVSSSSLSESESVLESVFGFDSESVFELESESVFDFSSDFACSSLL